MMFSNEVYPSMTAPGRTEYPQQIGPTNWSDSQLHQMSRSNNWNTNLNHPLNSQVNISQVSSPQFRPSAPAQMVQSNGWNSSNHLGSIEMNQNKNTNSQFSFSKVCEKMTSTKLLFLLVGFVLCAIPLSVFVTLWIDSRASSATTSTSPATDTTTTLPSQCYAYTPINDAYRNYVNGYGCCYAPFDTISYIFSGWYRITGSAGSKLLTTAVTTTSICGASYPGYFNGTLPATAGTSVSGTVCFYTGAQRAAQATNTVQQPKTLDQSHKTYSIVLIFG
ncbi:unnamed protein product [Rotaria magnacalcarata]|uniref:Uncharacterized protein n=5 Tax=Rotaria magnacalcarata TaxID=392030 RepID=A0A815R2M1_9BILA|nr:unnamed protein product [Rotaria magnacalcarata]CAF2073519.1 unnamed protein product [Rotaria magnacalcarata]